MHRLQNHPSILNYPVNLIGAGACSQELGPIGFQVLHDSVAALGQHRPVEYDSGVTLFPGRYSIKFLARDDETGRIGTYQTSFTIPNLNKVTKLIPISSIVLSSQIIDLKDALYNAEQGKNQAKNIQANPLVEDGRKLIPSVTRVFSAQRHLYIYLQAYRGSSNAVASGSRSPNSAASSPVIGAAVVPLIAFVGLYRDRQKIFETTAKSITPQAATHLGTVPINFNVNLAGIAPGEYRCQVTVLDPGDQRVAFWVGPLILVP